MSKPATSDITRIHLIFKTHLDVGFTDFAANVVKNYVEHYIPKAIELARRQREAGSPDRFLWTTGSWLIYEYLEQADAAGRKQMENAIASGDIAWHALPFTTHSENMDVSLFRFGLSLAQALDRRFDRHTIAAKMTDVPGHTRGIVPLLAEAGVQFLHIGVNGASTPPDVPPVFVWRDPPSGADVMVMYHKGTYGDLMVIPGLNDAISFAHTGDNLGPQTIDQLSQTYEELHERFPGVEVNASTMDTFAAQLASVRERLPVITQEIGDTWIHGAGTDPRKVAQYRELLRWRKEKLAGDGVRAEYLGRFSRKLILIPEHTWGLDLKTHLGDWQKYRNADFHAARGGTSYQKMEASWQEQRDYLRQAVESLPPELRAEAEARLTRLDEPAGPSTDFQPVDSDSPLSIGEFTLAFDPQTGAITGLSRGGIHYAGKNLPFGKFWYETFSAADYARFHRQYNINERFNFFWSIPDFNKPGLEGVALEHKIFEPFLAWIGKSYTPTAEKIRLLFQMPPESWQDFGAPKMAALDITGRAGSPELAFDLRWFEKTATRLPEAVWFSFCPQVRHPRRWWIEKLGEWISPMEVIRDGNRHLHASGEGVRGEEPGLEMTIQSLDAPLVAPGKPSLLDFNNHQPNLRRGFHFNLYNNLWGTNFPMWYEEDARFRFRLALGENH